MSIMTPQESLVLSHVSAGYRDRKVIRDLSLDPIQPGYVTALVGPNGAGKSTLLRVLAGLHPATGSIRLGDRELLQLSLAERAEHVTFMPQALPQRVALTVLEAVMSALKASPLAGMDGGMSAVQDRSMAILERIGIADLALEPLDHLSGGQRQLASLAQSVVREPKLLLLDEPTSALDLRHQVVVMHLIHDLAAEGRIVIVVLHDLNLAARWSRRIVMLHDGHAHAVGTPDEAITPNALAMVYGVEARVEQCTQQRLQVIVDGPKIDKTDAAR